MLRTAKKDWADLDAAWPEEDYEELQQRAIQERLGLVETPAPRHRAPRVAVLQGISLHADTGSSSDPLVMGGESQGWNRTGYAWNNPVSYVDPSGYCRAPVSKFETVVCEKRQDVVENGIIDGLILPSGSTGGDLSRSWNSTAAAPTMQVIADGITEDSGVGTAVAIVAVQLGGGLMNLLTIGEDSAEAHESGTYWGYGKDAIRAASLFFMAKGALRLAPARVVSPLVEEPGYIYRGVSANHPALKAARAGKVVPGNPAATLTTESHNVGGVSSQSQFTSWSRKLSIARFHALKDGPGGVILRVPECAPPPGARWSWEWSEDLFGEGEVLMRGIRNGVEVHKP